MTRKNSIWRRLMVLIVAFALMIAEFAAPARQAEAATGSVRSVSVTNLPADKLTLRAGSAFVIRPKVTVTGTVSKSVGYITANSKIVTVDAKGRIVAKKKGSAKVTIYAKADRTKKCVITVTVGTPSTGVKLDKTSLTVTKGYMRTLKAMVTPNAASNKNVVWKSSDTKIATVSARGIVSAKKAGRAVITATASDGSGKKASCVVTVNDPVVVKNLEVLTSTAIRLTLSGKYILKSTDMSIYSKMYNDGTYNRKCAIKSVYSKDGIIYTIRLQNESYVKEGDLVKILVPKLKSQKETTYFEKAFTKTTTNVITAAKGDAVKAVDGSALVYSCGGIGFTSTTISSLPAGVTYKKKSDDGRTDYIEISGQFKKAGIFKTTVKSVDEVGSVYIHTITWQIYDENTLVAVHADKVDVIIDKNQTYIDGRYIAPMGGSGKYNCKITGDNYGAFMLINRYGSWYLEGRINQSRMPAGKTYPIKISVEDTQKPGLATEITVNYTVIQGVKITGVVKDLEGNPILNKSYKAEAVVEKRSAEYKKNTNVASGKGIINVDIKDDGRFELMVKPGTYDLVFNNMLLTVQNEIRGLTVTRDTDIGDIVLPLYKVKVIIPEGSGVKAEDLSMWTYDTHMPSIGTKDSLYVGEGTYECYQFANGSGWYRQVKIAFTVKDKGIETTASVN